MKSTIKQVSKKLLVGIETQTNYLNELRPATSIIGACAAKYFGQQLCSKIPNRKAPGITYAVYTNFEPDEYGNYTYFIGEEVSKAATIPEGMVSRTIEAGVYEIFTSNPGQMPKLILTTWQEIWKITKTGELQGERNYISDFEVHDKRGLDPDKAVFDIYIGLK